MPFLFELSQHNFFFKKVYFEKNIRVFHALSVSFGAQKVQEEPVGQFLRIFLGMHDVLHEGENTARSAGGGKFF